MTLEIKFTTAICVSGKDLREIKTKFMNIPLYHPETIEKCEFVDFDEITRVDDDSYEDMLIEFDHA